MGSSLISAQVIVNGSAINVIDVEVCLTKSKASESFHATLALYDPAAAGIGSSDDATVNVTINGGQIGGDFKLEHVYADFAETKITISGRDTASVMIDKLNTQTFTNHTPDQVIRELAEGVGTDIDSFSDEAGKIYHSDWNAITHRASKWEAIQNIADLWGKNAYVTGGTLYVKDINEQLPVYSIYWSSPSASGHASSNVICLKCSRNFQMSKKINVKAHTHNYKQKKTLKAEAQAGGSGSGELNYEYVVPSAMQDQLENIAKKKSSEHAKHAFDIDVEIPGDAGVEIRMQLQLSGTGTIFDTAYDITDIEHRASWDGGFTTTIKGKTAGTGSSSSGD